MQIACCVLFYSDSSSKLVYLLSNNIICISESFMHKSNIHALQWNAFWSYFTGCENVTFVMEHDLFDRSCSRKDFVVPLVQNGLDGLIKEKKSLSVPLKPTRHVSAVAGWLYSICWGVSVLFLLTRMIHNNRAGISVIPSDASF